ncbi:MAG: response regulator [Acidobacteria bacterium]|nr:response regulator [Acidobacteriota bacterium]
MRIIILDDEPDIRYLTAIGLERFGGMTAREAASANEAIALARETRPDVILLDVFMPLEDGPAVLERLRQDPSTSDVPVIFMTANPAESDVGKLLGLGAVAVLEKPFDPVTLGDRIRVALRDA